MLEKLPSEFLTSMRGMLSNEEYAKFCDEMCRPANTFVRLNTKKVRLTEPVQEVAWCPEGLVLSQRPNFTFDPLLHAGAYYVQEQSSMFLRHVLSHVVKEPIVMLDLCAAPGGKSTLALSALPEGSVLVANEPIRQRAQILAENISKWGLPNVIVTNNMPADYSQSNVRADVVLLDVPCSGEGMFRKDPENIGEWSQQKVVQCQQLQRQIASQAWNCLKNDGFLIYSTCTYNIKENEENVDWICRELGAEIVSIPVPAEWGIGCSRWDGLKERVYRFIPGIHPSSNLPSGEGLFIAVMRKTSNTEPARRTKANGKQPQVPSLAKQFIATDEPYRFTTNGQDIVAIPETMYPVYEQVTERLHVLLAGTTIGQQKGRYILPAQQLALSVVRRNDVFPEVEVSWKTAVDYLRREAIAIAEAPKGICLLTYQGLPIGFVKNLGNRANNLYPAEWRIRSTHIPDLQPSALPKCLTIK